MKKGKKTLLAIVSALCLLTIFSLSCKKSSDPVAPPPAAPTITDIAPAIVPAGSVITITGTNLGSATVEIATVVATIGTNTETSITATVPAGTAVGDASVRVTTAGGTIVSTIAVIAALPASSDLVAAAKLAAHWPFKTDSKETVTGNPAAKIEGTTFGGTGGPFGTYANFTNGYLVYNPIPALNAGNSLDQYTVSMWVKIKNNNKDLYPATGGKYTSLFQLSSTQIGGVYGPYALTLHTNQDRPTDEFAFGAVLRHIDGHEFIYGENPNANYDHIDDSTYAVKNIAGAGDGSKWIHVAQTFYGYSTNPRPLVTYINGEKVDEHLLHRLIWAGENLNPKPGGADSKITFGTFQFKEDFPNGPWGVPPTAAEGIYWAHGITAGISDVRFFKEPIEDGDVVALYLLGLQGK